SELCWLRSSVHGIAPAFLPPFVGRKRYWRGLLSDIFLGQTMRRVLDVLRTDIVNVWNMHDPSDHLKKTEFLALLSVVVEDLSDEPKKSSLRCLVAFLVDLTLTMDTLFYLVLSRGQKPMTVGLINQALRIYKKAPVHNSIRTWADGWGVFSHLDAEVVIQKIADIITENSVKPERWEMKADSAEEAWMTVDTLREA
ncbi:hypothetical protein B0H11DRAFT_2427470, partial [Mycena galericulata]